MTVEHSHPPGFYPPPAAEGDKIITPVKSSVGVPDSVRIQYSDNPLGKEVLMWPREGSENDKVAFQRGLDRSHLGFDSNNAIAPGDSSMPLCGRCNVFHELAPGSLCDPIYDLAQFSNLETEETNVETAALEMLDEEEEKPDDATDFSRGGPGPDNGGGGFGDKNGRGEKDGNGGGDGGAAGGTSGSGSNGSSYDPFWGFNGDGGGWYSSMVAVFILAWLALRSLWMAISMRPPAGIKHLDEAINPRISSQWVGCMVVNHWSSGRNSDDEDDGAAGGAGCFGDVLAADPDSQLDGLSLKTAANNPATIPGGPLDILPVLLKKPEASLPLPYPHRLSIVPSTIFTILSRVHSKTQTKATSSVRSTAPLTTPEHQNDRLALVYSSRSSLLCVSSAVGVF